MKPNLIVIFSLIFSQISWGDTVVTDEVCERGGGSVISSSDHSKFPPIFKKVCLGGKYKGSDIGSEVREQSGVPNSKECLQALMESKQFAGRITLLPDEGDFFLKGSDGTGHVITKNSIFKIHKNNSCNRDSNLSAYEVVRGLAMQAENESKVKASCRSFLTPASSVGTPTTATSTSR